MKGNVKHVTFKLKIILFYSFKGDDTAAAAAKSLQSCPTLCDPIDGTILSKSFPLFPESKSNLSKIAYDFFLIFKRNLIFC